MTEKVKDAAYYAKIEKFFKQGSIMWALKPGDVVEQKHIDIIEDIFGKQPKEEVLISIHATGTGRPIITKGAELIDTDSFFKQFKKRSFIETLEKWRVLTFHPSIKTHKQKVYTLVYAAGLAIVLSGVVVAVGTLIGLWWKRHG